MKGIGKLLLDKGIIEEDDIQIYLYGIKGGITIIVNILTALLIGLITGKMLEVIIFSGIPSFLQWRISLQYESRMLLAVFNSYCNIYIQ